jgi:hypothetical protein
MAANLHARKRLARQFALQTPLIIDLFGKLADAELLVFHQLETDPTTLRQALRGKAQTNFMYPATGDQDGTATLIEAVRNVQLLKGGNDGAAITL